MIFFKSNYLLHKILGLIFICSIFPNYIFSQTPIQPDPPIINSTVFCTGSIDTFYTNSIPNATSYQWYFQNLVPQPIPPWQTSTDTFFVYQWPDSAYSSNVSPGYENMIGVKIKACNGTNCSSQSTPTYIPLFQTPTAAFTISPDTICSSSPIILNSDSTASDYNWLVGGNIISSDQSTEYQIDVFGTGAVHDTTITLVTINGNCTDTLTDTIFVIEMPEISIADLDLVSPWSDCGYQGGISSLSIENQFSSNGEATSYFVDWGDGYTNSITDSSLYLTHNYSFDSIFSVSISAYNILGCSNTFDTLYIVGGGVSGGFINNNIQDQCAGYLQEYPLQLSYLNNGPGSIYYFWFNDTFILPPMGLGQETQTLINNIEFCDTVFYQYQLSQMNGVVSHYYDSSFCSYTKAYVLIDNGCNQKAAGSMEFAIYSRVSNIYDANQITCSNVPTPVYITYNDSCPQFLQPDPNDFQYIINWMDGTSDTISSQVDSLLHTYNDENNYNIEILFTVDGECSVDTALANVSICVEDPPVPNYYFSDSSFCINENLQIINITELGLCTGFPTFEWNINPISFVGTPIQTDSIEPQLSFQIPGEYQISVTAYSCGEVTVIDTILIIAPPEISFVGNVETTYCGQQDSLFLPVVIDDNYDSISFIWIIGSDTVSNSYPYINSDSINYNFFSDSIPLTYTVIVEVTNSCGTARDSIDIIINPIPEIIVSQISSDTICGGNNIEYFLSSTSPNTEFIWTIDPVDWINLYNAGNEYLSLTDTIVDTLSIQLFNGTSNPLTFEINIQSIYLDSLLNCSGYDTVVTVTINPAPMVVISPNIFSDTICHGESIFYDLSSPVAGSNFSWEIINPSQDTNIYFVIDTSQIDSVINIEFFNNASNPYTFNIVVEPGASGNECEPQIDTIKITVNPNPSLTIVPSGVISVCSNEGINYTFSSGANDVNYFWYIPTNLDSIEGIGNSGTGNIENVTLWNISNDSIHVEMQVTPYYEYGIDTCFGETDTVFFTVYPVLEFSDSTISLVYNDTVCSGDAIFYDFSSDIINVIYNLTSGGSYPGVIPFYNGIIDTVVINESGSIQTINLELFLSNGNCSGEDILEVNIWIYPEPVISPIQNDTICSGDSRVYELISNFQDVIFEWNLLVTSPPGISGSGNTDISETYFNFSGSQYELIYNIDITTTGHTCVGSNETFTVFVNPAPGFQDSTIEICSGEPFSFDPVTVIDSINPISAYTWTTTYPDSINSNNPVSDTIPIDSFIVYNTSYIPLIIDYTFTLTSSGGGCDGISHFYVEVQPESQVLQLSDFSICSGDHVNIAFPDNTAGINYYWTRLPGSNISFINGQDSTSRPISDFLINNGFLPDTTIYSIHSEVISQIASCPPSITSVSIIVNPKPEASISGTSVPHGPPWSETLFGTVISGIGPFSYLWTPTLSITGPVDDIDITTADLYSTTTFDFYVTDSKGCLDTADFTIEIDLFMALSVQINNNTDTCICNNESVVLTAEPNQGDPPYSYLWSTGATTQSITVSPDFGYGFNTTDTIYSVTVTDGIMQNTATDNYTITVHPYPEDIVLTDTEYCQGLQGSTVILGGTQNLITYTLTPLNIVLQGNGGTISFANIYEGTYTITGEYDPCNSNNYCSRDLGTVNVTENPKPEASISGTTVPHGPPWSETLFGTVISGIGPFSYLWTPTLSITGPVDDIDITTADLYSTTTFDFYVTDSKGCLDTADFTIEIDLFMALSVQINNNTDTCICNNESVVLTAEPNQGDPPYSYLWSTGATTQSITVSPDFGYGFNTTDTIYSVTVTDGIMQNTAIDTIIITVHPLPTDINFNDYDYCVNTGGVDVVLHNTQPGKTYWVGTQSQTAGGTTTTFNNLQGNSPSGTMTYNIYAEYAPCNLEGNGICTSDFGDINITANPMPLEISSTCSPNSYPTGPLGLTITTPFSQPFILYSLINVDNQSIVGVETGNVNGNGLEFDNVLAGNYIIQATNAISGCSTFTNDTCTIFADPLPEDNPIYGNGCFCQGEDGIIITLTGSQAGGNIVYSLYRNGNPTGLTFIGTGSSYQFPAQTIPGYYTVIATNIISNTPVMMSGSATIDVLPSPYEYFQFDYSLTQCQDNSVLFLNDSEQGVYYQLINNGVPYGPLVPGTDSLIVFNDIPGMIIPWDTGTYTVLASYTSYCASTLDSITCFSEMIGSVEIFPMPESFYILSDNICIGESVELLSSELNTEYFLYQSGVIPSNSLISQQLGTGDSLLFGPFQNAGVYYITAINQTTNCSANMYTNIHVNSIPQVFSVDGFPDNITCLPVEIRLLNSQPGIQYFLLIDNSYPAVDTIIGTGGLLSFGYQIQEGVYTVIARNPITYCTSVMADSVVKIHESQPQIMFPQEINCIPSDGPVEIGLEDSEIGVTYILKLSGISIDTLPGTNSAISFGFYSDLGNYTAIGITDSTGCWTSMIGTVNLQPDPSIFNITDNLGNICPVLLCQGSVLKLDNSQYGVMYQLIRNNSILYGPPVPGIGIGFPLSFGAINDLGVYNVMAYYSVAYNNNNYCPVMMNCDVEIVEGPISYLFGCCNNPSTGSCLQNTCCLCLGMNSSDTLYLNDSQYGVTYQLFNNGVITGNPVSGTNFPIKWAVSQPGFYEVQGTINSPSSVPCSAWMSGGVNIYIEQLPFAFAGNDTLLCSSISNFILNQSTATNYSSVIWSSSGSGTFDNVSNPHATYTPSISDKVNGNIVLSICATGIGCCEQEVYCDEIVINFDNPEVLIISSSNSIGNCGFPQQSVLFSAIGIGEGSLTYNWGAGLGCVISDQYGSSTTIVFPNNSNPQHNVFITITDSLGCTALDTVIITVDTLFVNASASSTNGSPPGNVAWIGYCNQQSSLFATAGPTSNIVSYEWNSPNGGTFSNLANINTNFSGPESNTYPISLSVTDIYGCVAISNITVHIDTLIISTVGNTYNSSGTFVLSDDTLTIGSCWSVVLDAGVLTGSGPYTFNWSGSCSTCLDGMGFSSLSTLPFTPTGSGLYNLDVSVEDSYGCIKSGAVLINIEGLPDLQPQFMPDSYPCSLLGWWDYIPGTPLDVGSCCVDQNVSNQSGKIRIQTSGGIAPFDFEWAGPISCINPTSSQVVNFYNCSGVAPWDYLYTVIVTDSFGCIDTASIELHIESPPTANALVIADCPGDLYNIPNSTVEVGQCCSAYLTGTYSGINPNYLWEPMSYLNPYTCNLSQPADSSCLIFSNAPTGNYPYNFIVTDQYGCSDTSSIDINVDTLIISSIGYAYNDIYPLGLLMGSPNDTLTIGSCWSVLLSTSIIQGTGLFNYEWTVSQCSSCIIPISTSSTAVFIPPSGGLFEITITVSDEYGCQAINKIIVNVNGLPQLHTQFHPGSGSCAPQTWWNYTFGDTMEVSSCCMDDVSVAAELLVNLTGGTGPFLYNWNQIIPASYPTCILSNSTSNVIDIHHCSGLLPQIYQYSVAVSDTYGCVETGDIVMLVNEPSVQASISSVCSPPELLNFPNSVQDTACTSCTVQFNAIASPSNYGQFTYLWSNASILNNPNLNNTTVTTTLNGYYPTSVTATDSFGCVSDPDEVYLTLVDPVIDSISFTPNKSVYCTNDTIVLTAIATADLPAVYNWSFVGIPYSGNPLIVGSLSNGTYPFSLRITDSNGCIAEIFDTLHVGIDPPNVSWQFYAAGSSVPFTDICQVNISNPGVHAVLSISGAPPFVLSNVISSCGASVIPGSTTPYSWVTPWHMPGAGPQCIYSITVTDTNGCQAESNDSINIWTTPSAAFNNCPVEVCPGSDAILQVSIDGVQNPLPLGCGIFVSYTLASTGIIYTLTCPALPICNIIIPNVTATDVVTLIDVGYDCSGINSFTCNGNISSSFNSCEIQILPEPEFTIIGDLDYCSSQTNPTIFNINLNTATGSPAPWIINMTPLSMNTSPILNSYSTTLPSNPVTINPSFFPPAGNFIVNIADGNGCTWEEDLIFTEHLLPDISSLTVIDSEICEGGCADISVTLTGTGPWELVLNDGLGQNDTIVLPPNVISPIAGPYTTIFSICPPPTGSGNYNFISLFDSYCKNNNLTFDNFHITMFDLPRAGISLDCNGVDTVNDLSICSFNNYNLNIEITQGSPPWSVVIEENGIPETIFINPVIATLPYTKVISDYCTGDKIIKLVSVTDYPTSSLSCTRYYQNDEVFIECLEAPTAKFCCSDSEICEGDNAKLCINLTGDPSCNHDWVVRFSNGSGIPITINIASTTVMPFSYEIVVSPSVTTTYTLIAVNYNSDCGSCDCYGEIFGGPVTVKVYSRPEIDISLNPNRICEGGSTQLIFDISEGQMPVDLIYKQGEVEYALTNINSSPYKLDLEFGEDIDNATYIPFQVIYALDNKGCINKSIKETRLKIEPLPIINITPCDIPIGNGETIEFEVVKPLIPPAISYEYKLLINQDSVLSYGTSYNDLLLEYDIETSYSSIDLCAIVKVEYPPISSPLFCIDTVCCFYIESIECVIDVPDAFTPNGDGINEELILVGDLESVNDVELLIFNRQGKLVKEFESRYDSWDGTYLGSPQQSDIYAYQLNAICKNGQSVVKSGSIALIR